MEKHYFSILFTIIGFLHFSLGCSIEGINWFEPETREILDTFRGNVFSSPTENIQGVNAVTQGEGLIEGPYITAKLENSILNIETNSAFANYENIETQTIIRYTISLRCIDSTLRNFVFIINIKDTNNNDPVFLPTNNYEFTIAPPVPPGFVVTTCLNDILVRDIDLTTQKIDFEIEGSDLFEISFDPSSQVAKEFKATLKTTNLIRSIAEPVKLTVTATDVDLTEGPPRTARATVVIKADSQFQFPDEPIFSQPFYLANYKSDNDLILQDKIFLRQGFDNLVNFSFESDYSEYFDFVVNQNDLSFNMKSPIPVELYDEKQIYLIVKATREHTSGATATVIVKLPEDTRIEFENAIYEGTITDNVLKLNDLKLKQGYEGFNITVNIESEYDFKANIESNVIKITMDPLATDVIENNNFINLQITASNNRTTAVTVVILEIIKNDYTTPVFEYNFYSGSYSTEIGLTLGQIILTQGFDDTVRITLEGEHSIYFEAKPDGPKITLISSAIPTDIFIERNIMITVLASKPRTVGAHATVNIELPSARYLDFEETIYEGSIENNDITLSNIVLTNGYASDVNFTLEGEFRTYFSIKENQNIVTIEIEKVIPGNILLENDIIVLTLSAVGIHAVPTSTSIVLQIIKEDHQTPMFSENLYSFKYENDELNSGIITLVQGFDETVTFELIGDHKEYFGLEPSLNLIKLVLKSSIPEDIIFNNKVIILNILARKPRTVGANAAVYITFPQEMIDPTVMSFTQNAYKGLIEGNSLAVGDIVLETGYTPQTEFILSGEYSKYFSLLNSSDVIKLTPASDMALEDLEDNNVIILEVKATRERAISATTVVVIDILKTVIVPPVFEKAFYTGTYTSTKGLLFDEVISLGKGFDSTVEFSLEEEDAKWFSLVHNGPNNFSLRLEDEGLNEITDRGNLVFTVVATKVNSPSSHATIVISLVDNNNMRILEFEQTSYLGNLENKILDIEEIRVLGGITASMEFSIIGDYASYFSTSKLADSIQINLIEFSTELTDNNDFIILNLKVSEPGAVNGSTTIVVRIVNNEENITVTPVFSEAYYTGQYSKENGLVFLSVITLIQGYDETVTFTLDNDDSKAFSLVKNGLNNFSLILNGSISEEEIRNYLLFTVIADKPNTNNGRAAIVISLTEPPEIVTETFDQILYNGKLDNGVLSHDKITLSGFEGINIEIKGEHNALFKSDLTNGVVKVEPSGVEFPKDLTYILLELQAATAKAILFIDVSFSGNEDVSFDRILYNGKLDNGVLSHDKITLSGFTGTNIQITGEHNALFKSTLTNGDVKVELSGEEFPRDVTYILLELQAANARAKLLIDVSFSGNEDVSFDRILYNGKLDNGVLSHDKITLSGFTGTNIQITGEHNALFKSTLTNGDVKVELSGEEFPRDVTYILLELQAANARAKLLIDVSFSGNEDVSFDRILYNGKLDNGVLSHDKITLSGFTGTNIQITGEHNALFKSTLTNGDVKVELSGEEFPRDVTYILLELQAANARAKLLIDVSFSGNEDVSFDRILYNGKLDNGVLSHDKITLSGFTGTNIQITGEHNALFKSTLTNGDVKVELSGEEFPRDVTYILLELQAANARAKLLIDVSFSGNEDVSFDRILYNGKLDNGVLSHDKITLSGFTGTNIQITGEHNALFKSTLTNGDVKVELSGEEFPRDVTYILLELQAANARAKLLIDVSFSGNEDVSFDRILYNGKLDNGVLSHDKITLSGFTGTNIQITGEHNALFKSTLTNGDVKVELSGEEFPRDVTYILLELQAANARAKLLIDVSFSGNEDVSFDRILYNGKLDNGVLSHDKITLSGFTGTNIQITGEHNALFKSTLTNGDVKVERSGEEFPRDVTYILLELQAANARAKLLIDVSFSGNEDVSFDRILYNGKLDNGVLSHDKITLSGFTGTNIQITGEHNALFKSTLTNGDVKVELSGEEFPRDVTYILLELQAANARAKLLIDVSFSGNEDVSFDRILYNGKLDNGVLSHDKITLSGFTGTNIQITGEHNALFKSTLTNGDVKVELSGEEFPRDVTYILLELQAANARAKLLIDVSFSGNEDVSFDRILYNGKLDNGVLSHDKITLSGFTGTNIQITGEHNALFKSTLTNGDVKVELSGEEFPRDVTYILLELQAANARAKLLIDVSFSGNEDVSFDRILYNGKLDNGVLSHDKITLSGFTGTNIQITGEHNALFKSTLTNGDVKVELSGEEFPRDVTYILLELQAANARAKLLIDVSFSGNEDVSFDRILYNGKLDNGVLSHDKITLSGFTGTNIQITGEHNALFKSTLTNGDVKVELSGEEFPRDVTYILLELQAANARAKLLIDVSFSGNEDVSFDRILYNGKLDNGVLSHDKITLSGFTGTNIQITGEHNALFKSTLTNGDVKVELSGEEFPRDVTYILLELQAANARAKLLIDVSFSGNEDVSFDRILYNGKLDNGVLSHDKITLSGFTGTNIQITGEHNALFKSTLTNGDVKVELSGEEFPRDVTYILLELQAANARAKLLIDVSFSGNEDVSFDRILYNGKLDNGVLSHDKITLSGFTGTNIQITGEHNALFKSTLTNGDVKVELSGEEFPRDVTYILLELQAANARAKLLIDVSFSGNEDVSFDRILYNGKLDNGVLSHDKITLSGFTGTNIQITGEHNALFKSTLTNGDVKVELSGEEFPRDVTYILLELQAANARAKLLIDVSFSGNEDVSFDRILYNGKLDNGVLSHDKITLSGFTGTNIQITGEHNALFKSTLTNGDVKVELSGEEFPRDVTYILLELQAANARAKLLIDVSFSGNEDVSFDRILYNGKLDNGVLSHDKITLSGFTGTNIQITGEHNALFKSTLTNGDVKVELSGEEFPRDVTYILLELQAANARAKLLIDVSFSGNEDVSFDRILYNGKLDNGVLSHDKITLSGFTGTNIQITGEHNALFKSTLTNGDVKVELSGEEFPRDVTYILLELQAANARAKLLIDVSFSGNEDVSFDRILYNGKLDNGVLSHDKITLSGFIGTNIQITGEHNALFKSELTNGVVKVEPSGEEFPKDLTYILLEIQAATAKAILLIDVNFTENPQTPIVSFKSQSYFLWADVQQTGVVGAVEATADNGEDIIYSLTEHIQSQININSKGEILLTAAFDKGVYKFKAVATSVQSQIQATAPVLLRVDTVPECNSEVGLSPLIILERLEEEPHLNLVVLNQIEHKGCQYMLTNVFPKDQSWLYVDNDGLHTKAIDREDGSIAFMTLSQIQVELTLECDGDEVPTFAKRSLGTEDKSDLYSYDDGPNKWVLTDTIPFNARRSFVNLIVKDINDNSPIFLGKGNEPIYVGYPVSDLEGTVSPRALAELKATDADIGENAAIVYWSQEDNLAVSPSTGLVHVRNNAQLENNSRLTIYAIDQNGKGRNGTIDIVVKLLDKNQIIVLTVRDAFLEDEVDVVNELSTAVGYEIKVLRAVVIPNNNEELSRRKRDVESNSQASLQLYAYGLLESEPVDINQLTRDINDINIAAVNIASIVSLEDHLVGLEIYPAPGRDTGLLVSTIVLAVLLFIAIVAIAVRFFLKWKTIKNYNQFSNRSSSVSQLAPPNLPKIEVVPKLRPDEIKRSERRLQEMLETPIEKAPVRQAGDDVKPSTKALDDTLVNISSAGAELPVVIQSIDKLKDKTDESDDNDEFGEVKKPRKSVVTFNENVEKIIHIEDVPDDDKSSQSSYSIYRF